MVKQIPDGYHAVTPYLIVDGGTKALAFYAHVFGAVERMRIDGAGGKIGHAEFTIGDSFVMLADEHPEVDALCPTTVGGTPVTLHVYVDDVDAVVAKAVAAGARLTRPVADQFYGDRVGGITDPFGHRWSVATHKEDLTNEELQRRAAAQGH
jgi:PhnB protein